MTEPKKLKVALIGAGGSSEGEGLSAGFSSPGSWGQQHARIYSTRSDVDFRAIVGRDAARTQRKASEYGTRPYTDVQTMLEKEQPDLVSICLPNQSHYETTLTVLRAGVPVFAEKPLVFEMREADSLLEEAAKRNVFFAINFNHRYAMPAVLARQAIEAGKLGTPTFASWRFGGEGASGHPHANLIETQCHGFDMLEYLCGPIASVMAEMTDVTGGGFRTLSLALKFANGAVGSLIGTYDSSYAYPDTHRIELDGTNGRIVIRDTVQGYTYHPIGSELGESWQAGYFNDVDREFHRTFDKHVDELFDALRSGKEPPIHAEAGRRALRLALASIESYETGRRVDVRSV